MHPIYVLINSWLGMEVLAPPRISYVERNLKTIKSIYDLTVYPKNVPIIQHGASRVPPGLFSQHATGRISPVGNFTGFEDSIEYFFGLAPMPIPSTGNLAFYDARVVQYTSGCPEVAASVVYLSTGQVDPETGTFIGNTTTILKQVLLHSPSATYSTG